VVTHVRADGPASGIVAAGDVLETAGGEALWTPLHWNTRAARLGAGEGITVRVRRGGESQDVALVAAGPAQAPANLSLGLTLRAAAGAGAAVVGVAPGSSAERAGLLAGDVITRVADTAAPSPAEVRRIFAAAEQGQALLLAYTRGDTHRVTALEK
jgi:S1-C subfamily serine protease